MKNIKFRPPALAIIIAAVGAIASTPKQACTGEPQYYYNGQMYTSAGVLGQDYICVNGSGTCTYIGSGGFYQPCQSGIYTPLRAKFKKK